MAVHLPVTTAFFAFFLRDVQFPHKRRCFGIQKSIHSISLTDHCTVFCEAWFAAKKAKKKISWKLFLIIHINSIKVEVLKNVNKTVIDAAIGLVSTCWKLIEHSSCHFLLRVSFDNVSSNCWYGDRWWCNMFLLT